MVSEGWFHEEDQFRVLTNLLQKSVFGGTIRARSVEPEVGEILEQGVEEGFITKDELVACPGCDRYYDVAKLPLDCDCGTSLAENDDMEPDVVQYHSMEYPDILQQVLDDSVDSFQIEYQDVAVEEFPASELHSGDDTEWHLHISPRFEIDSGIHVFPGFRDVLLSWNRVPRLVTSPEEVVDEVRDFLTAEESIKEWAEQNDDGILNNGPQPDPDDFTWDSSELTLLHQHDKERCNQWAKQKYGYTYNSMFERMGAHFLHHLFPHVGTFFAAGENKPDGYLVQENRTYLVEAKCWSSDFKITKERDKMIRYIDDFNEYVESTPGCNFNLYGYIFIAHSFKDSSLQDDIEDVERRVDQTLNLDTICINDEMIAATVECLNELYRMDPSAPYRIFEHSQWYRDILDDFTDYTQDHGTVLDAFQTEILDIIEAAAQTEAGPEQHIADGFGPRSRWSKLTP